MGKIPFLKNQNGAALVIGLIMLIILTLIGLAAMFTSTFEVILSGNKRGATDAFFAADSGVQVAIANIENFDIPGKYINNQYNPFTDKKNPNPTNAKVIITYNPGQTGAPRGLGLSATGNYEYNYYLIESTGEDQLEVNSNKSTCTIQQKVVRLIPTIQGGN